MYNFSAVKSSKNSYLVQLNAQTRKHNLFGIAYKRSRLACQKNSKFKLESPANRTFTCLNFCSAIPPIPWCSAWEHYRSESLLFCQTAHNGEWILSGATW